jgi:hypothetical protein
VDHIKFATCTTLFQYLRNRRKRISRAEDALESALDMAIYAFQRENVGYIESR